MKVIVLSEPGSVNNLNIPDIPIPKIEDGEVLTKVKAIGINLVGAKTRNSGGLYKLLRKEDALVTFEETAKAHKQIESHRIVGKIVVTI